MANDRIHQIRLHLRREGDPDRADSLEEYFRTAARSGKEKLGFYGTPVSEVRELARKHRDLSEEAASHLLMGPMHEERLLALLVLLKNFVAADEEGRDRIYRLYFAHLPYLNHWDLVDISAEHIVGGFLADKPRRPIHDLARSASPWERRIALMATHHFLKAGEFEDFEKVAALLVTDPDETIQEALGKTIAEAAKRDIDRLDRFLRKHYKEMPKATLRLAIERLPQPIRVFYLKARML